MGGWCRGLRGVVTSVGFSGVRPVGRYQPVGRARGARCCLAWLGVDGVSVRRWRRYGHDRWYVATAGGVTLGWLDADSGTVHVTETDMAPVVYAALAEQHLLPEEPTALAAGVDEEFTSQVLHAPPAVDLAATPAGAQVRAKALEARAAAPVRTALARIFDLKTQERAWRMGADGEVQVAALLRQLDPAWRVLHALPIGDQADLDHLVIGPGGVFTINTKHHRGGTIWVAHDAVLVNGQRTHYLRKARAEARRAAVRLAAASGQPVIA